LSSIQYKVTECAIVILAAGQSSRLGSPKQLLQFNGKSLLRHSVEEALQTRLPVIVVVGANSQLIKDELKNLNITIEENKRWHEGMSTSLQCGLAAAKNLKNEIDGIIFMVSDQPFVSATLLTNLLKAQDESGLPIAASGYAGALGTPVLFHKFFFDELMNLRGDTGARKLIEKYKNLATEISFPEGVIDIDTVEDYKALLQKLKTNC
jgi:molybdenum cofactor cytidylyltransferase